MARAQKLSDEPRERLGAEIVAELNAELQRLGIDGTTTRYISERHLVRISWPPVTEGALSEEGVEFPATREGLERMRPVLRKWARQKKRVASSEQGA